MDFQIVALLSAFPQYKLLGVGREDGISEGEHAAILYDSTRLESLRSGNFWFSETPSVPGSMHWGNRITRICTWSEFKDLSNGQIFWHFNLHVDHESEPSRDRSAALLLERTAEVPPGVPIVVTGDFNEHEDKPGIVRMKAAGFRDTYRVLHPDEPLVGTFNGFGEGFDSDKIDYIFVNEPIEVLAADIMRKQVGGGWPSDHAAVTSTLRVER